MNRSIDRPSLAQVVGVAWDAVRNWWANESADIVRRRLGVLVLILLMGAFGLVFTTLSIFPDRNTWVAGNVDGVDCRFDASLFPPPNRLGTSELIQVTANLTQALNLSVRNSGSCAWNGVTLQRDGGVLSTDPISLPVAGINPNEFFNTQIEFKAPPADRRVYEIVYRMYTPEPNRQPFGLPIVLTVIAHTSGAEPAQPYTPVLRLNDLVKYLLLLAPMLAGMWMAFWHAGRFVKEFYSLKDETHGRNFVWTRVFGLGPGVKATAREGQLECKAEHEAIEKIGGPGQLIVHGGTVVLIERGSRYSRLAGPGLRPLGAFERVRAVVDARPLNRERKETVYTKDGIEVTTKTIVSFRLMKQKEGEHLTKPPTRATWRQLLPAWFGLKVKAPTPPSDLPASPETVRSIVYEAMAFANGDTLNWESVMKTDIDDVIAEKMLDELWAPDSDRKPRQELVDQIIKDKTEAFRKRGVELLDLSIGPLAVTDDQVDEQRRKYWLAYWASRSDVTQAEGEAEALRQQQTARAEAQAELIQAIAQSFRMMAMSGATLPSREVALRMLEVIARTMKASLDETEEDEEAADKAVKILNRLYHIINS